jgi:hypothetical protein
MSKPFFVQPLTQSLFSSCMQRFILIICLWFPVSALFGQQGQNALFRELDKVIDSSIVFDAHKYNRIQSIKNEFNRRGDTSAAATYQYQLALYEEYRIFKFDTAFFYAKQLEQTAARLNDPLRIAEAHTKLAFVLLSAGMFKEADETMNSIRITGQPDSLKAVFFLTKGRFYYDLADYTNDEFFYPGYFKQAGDYLDSALAIYPRQSFEYIYYSGLRQMKMGDLNGAFKNFQLLIQGGALTEHELALTASTLSFIYFTKRDNDSAIHFQVRAAIADIRSSTKETFAVLNLSQMLFEKADFNRASRYIRKAVDDATFYGARQRKIQVSTILPIIQSSEINYIKRQRQLWIIYGAVVSVVVVLFALMLLIIRRQNKRLKQAKKEISEAHAQLHNVNGKLTLLNTELQQVNANLLDTNARLEESNKIKEEYVGYFFTQDAQFFQKFEKLKNAIEEKIHYGKFNEIRYITNAINLKTEKAELVKSFDKAFLKLFPRFVEEFNALLEEDNRIKLQEGEILNTDLRIYALLRLGIRENEKIAEILEYSVKSIYAYKTRIRNRARVPKEDFDRLVMEIRSA